MSPEAIQKIMADYSQFERKAAPPSTYTTEQAPGVTRHIGPEPFGSFIVDFDVSDQDVDAVIRREIAFFSSVGKSFEWKVFETDLPHDLGSRLIANGFSQGEPEAFMVLDLNSAPAELFHPSTLEPLLVTTWAGVQDMAQVQNQVWGGDHVSHADAIWAEIQDPNDSMTLYVIYIDGKPVSTARQTFVPDSPFSGLWGGSTLSDFRGIGCYSALLKVRAMAAKSRGVRYLTIDASPMSRPIVERLGFELVTLTHPYEWHFEGSKSR